MTAPEKNSVLNGLRILVVEDEALVALQLEDMLTDLGCTVIGPAARVRQALDLLERQAIDAAVLDLNVAGELVYPVADRLTDRGILFLFATGYRASALTEAYRIRPLLQKPFLLSSCARRYSTPCRRESLPAAAGTPLQHLANGIV
jgi:CheY-like chemotaxis protein